MLEDELTLLAVTGGTTVVAAMATDAWKTTKTGVVKLFRRGGPPDPEFIDEQLESNAKLLLAAKDSERARASLAMLWQGHLESLLAGHPEAAREVEQLLKEIRAELPEAGERWVQHNIAKDHGRVFAAQGGNVIVHEEAGGGRESS